VPARSSPGDEATPSGEEYEFTYRGSDGRLKATFEQAFRGAAGAAGGGTAAAAEAPWHLGFQMAEGSLAWNEDLRERLLLRCAAVELDLDDEALAAQLARLRALLPDVGPKLGGMRPATVAALLADLDAIPARLLTLKTVFPGANAGKLAVRVPGLVLGHFDEDHLQRLKDNLTELLPALDVDRLVEENPGMLDVEELMVAMAEAERLMPGVDLQKAMGADPQLILSFQRGGQLIPYDPPMPTRDQDAEDTEDEYGAYYR
jgi:hypothetical protein